MATLELGSLAATATLGRMLAELAQSEKPIPILLRGGLGCGKTTLAAEITRNLPGGQEAEVSSPSFTICNLYPTSPPVLHCDLYRCQNNAPDELWEFLDDGTGMLMVEWSEYMRPKPNEYLDISFNVVNDKRLATVGGYGPRGEKIEKRLEELWQAEALQFP